MTKRLLRMPDLKAKIPLQKTHIYEEIRKGTFPKPVKLGPRAVAWVESEVDAWIVERITQRDEREATNV